MASLQQVIKETIRLAHAASPQGTGRVMSAVEVMKLVAAPNPARAALSSYLTNLESSRLKDLIAVMYVGRGDLATFSEARRLVGARAGRSTAEDVSDLEGKAPLAQYLEDGERKMVEGGQSFES